MKTNGKLMENLRKAIGEEKWAVIAGFSAVAVIGATNVLPHALALSNIISTGDR